MMSDLIRSSNSPKDHRGQVILAVSIVCGLFETVAVFLRFLARRKLGAQWLIDDWLIVVALVPNYAMIVAGGFCQSFLIL